MKFTHFALEMVMDEYPNGDDRNSSESLFGKEETMANNGVVATLQSPSPIISSPVSHIYTLHSFTHINTKTQAHILYPSPSIIMFFYPEIILFLSFDGLEWFLSPDRIRNTVQQDTRECGIWMARNLFLVFSLWIYFLPFFFFLFPLPLFFFCCLISLYHRLNLIS